MEFKLICPNAACGRATTNMKVKRPPGHGGNIAICPHCGQRFNFQQWAQSSQRQHGFPNLGPGTYVANYRTVENKGRGLCRAICRPMTFAGQVAGYGAIRPANDGWYRTNFHGCDDVKIYIFGDGVTLEGKIYFPKTTAYKGKVILFLSGSGGTAGAYSTTLINWFLGEGYPFLAVNYRGFGTSTGTPSSHGLYTDAQAMLDYLIEFAGFNIHEVVVLGYSLGSGPAVELVLNNQDVNTPANGVRGLIVLHGMSSSSANATGVFAVGKPILNVAFGFRNVDKLGNVVVPTYVIVEDSGTGVKGKQGTKLSQRIGTLPPPPGAPVVAARPNCHTYRHDGDHFNPDRMFDGAANPTVLAWLATI